MRKIHITILHTVCYLLLCLGASATVAADSELMNLDIEQVRRLIPSADRLAQPTIEPPARAVYAADKIVGYVYFSDAITPIPAYSGLPVKLLVALGVDAHVLSVELRSHQEPILVIGITDSDLEEFLVQYQAVDTQARVRIGAFGRPGYIGVDGISGATITAMVINSSIMKSARIVAAELGLPPETQPVAGLPADNSRLVTSDPAHSVTHPAERTGAQEEPFFEQEEWRERWEEQQLAVLTLIAALVFLMAVLFFQDWLVVRPRLFVRVRIAYLLFTVIFLGVIFKAQLSIINMMAFLRILVNRFTWETLLLEPIIFILWVFVAISVILWGRGVFCGWLCPFGAVQELLHKVSERLKLPTWEFPPMVHERLWAIKYFILIALVGLSLESMEYTALLAELEPFKTVFVLRFDREIVFVLWAVFLLGISMFNSKFYCKYLCPLGAALSFLTRFRIFDWLRRRKECGHPCQSCAANCQISAIKPTGEIIDTECHYCLECQVTYWDDHRCPPLVQKRERREKRAGAGAVIASDQPLD